MSNDQSFWKRKLAAYLHDPPHKPMRIAGHEDARKSFALETGLDEEDLHKLFERPADHYAAAADRMIFPDPGKTGVRTDWKSDSECSFLHPLCGSKLTPQVLPATSAEAEEWLHTALQRAGNNDEESWEATWWKTWRLWPEIAARKNPLLAYLVADTRIPHHTLWHHNGLVSAINSCEGKCSFLLLQIGPVQDFIRQARSTRDLWAGSFLLSYLIARGMFAVARKLGPDSIVFPQLRGIPLMDRFGYDQEAQFWNEPLRSTWKDELLTPNLPNRFLALVPTGWRDENGQSIAELAKQAIRNAWNGIAKKVHSAIQAGIGEDFPGWDQFWDTQTSRFPVVDYVIHDWKDTQSVIQMAGSGTPPLHGGWDKHPLRDAIRWATEKIPDKEKDSRCYPLNPGFVWALHYAATEWKFAAAKNARPFAAWDNAADVEKDHLDGRNEVLGGHKHDEFWDAMRSIKWSDTAPGNLFKGRQEYGAITTIKRLFPFVWLKEPDALDVDAPKFDSVPEIADINSALESDQDSGKYYAILCMDGDDMGQWVGGGKTPFLKDVLSGDETDEKTPLGYFKKQWKDGWDKVRAPLTPSFHAAFSEALGNFSLYCARQIVEAFNGQLIYAGGDDVLAMLPVESAVDCADALQTVFRGIDPRAKGRSSQRVQDTLADLFEFPAPGFICCRKHAGKQEYHRPNWPLMVPGPAATASAGIAIGSVRSPMQDVIQAARNAEHTAKEVKDKGALAVRVLKRSGESLEFAARFDSGVIGLWAEIWQSRKELSGRFIHRYVQKIQPLLATVSEGRASWCPEWNQDGIEILPIIEAELVHSLKNQSSFKDQKCRELARFWTGQLTSLDPENFMHFWLARAFVSRLLDPNSND